MRIIKIIRKAIKDITGNESPNLSPLINCESLDCNYVASKAFAISPEIFYYCFMIV